MEFRPLSLIITVNSNVSELITTRNNNNRVSPAVKCETNKIKHCEINNGQSVDLNIVFASWNNFHFTSHRSRFKNRTKQVRFYLLFNFHLQFTNKSVGPLWYVSQVIETPQHRSQHNFFLTELRDSRCDLFIRTKLG